MHRWICHFFILLGTAISPGCSGIKKIAYTWSTEVYYLFQNSFIFFLETTHQIVALIFLNLKCSPYSMYSPFYFSIFVGNATPELNRSSIFFTAARRLVIKVFFERFGGLNAYVIARIHSISSILSSS